ncbi:MAG: phosphoglycerate mutase family protein [Rhodobacteraceae bacterium]|nr:phosphoglycerate mutase family protein [Paracoccaceae bacterium]
MIRLLRHAEAQKNVENRHGGSGSGLTENGLIQISNYVVLNSHPQFQDASQNIYYVDRPQCKQSAITLAANYGTEPCVLGNIAPFHLGVLEGLSEDEALQKHPEEASRISLWRAGLIDISELKLPGSTDEREFFRVGLLALKNLTKNLENIVIVGTRSILVLFWNILSGHTPESGGGYVEMPWPNMHFIDFDFDREKIGMLLKNT